LEKKLLFILNPYAGTKQTRNYIPEILACFQKYGYLCTMCVTTEKGDGARLAEKYAKGMELVVCSGGDGTYNETVAGLMQLPKSERPPLGYIPAGSTNDLASSLNLSSNILSAVEDVMTGEKHSLDVGCFNGRMFTYVASFGAFTRTSYATPQNIKNVLGHVAYFLEGVKELSSIHPEHVKVTANGQVYEDEYLFGAVSNSFRLGGGVISLSHDDVDMDDGLFEVMLIRYPKTTAQLQEILRALSTKKYDTPMLDFFKASDIEIQASAVADWSLDGEYEPGCKNIRIENLHDAIELIAKNHE